jgi:hypothetical protein
MRQTGLNSPWPRPDSGGGLQTFALRIMIHAVTALAAQYRLAPLRMAYNPGSFPVVTRGYMPLLGFEVGEPIRPNHRCTPENLA